VVFPGRRINLISKQPPHCNPSQLSIFTALRIYNIKVLANVKSIQIDAHRILAIMSGLKLKLSMGGGFSRTPSISTPAPAPETPLVTPGGRPKIKLKNGSRPSTPAPVEDVIAIAPKPKKTKAGRATKPSAKVLESRKRGKEESDEEVEEESTISVQPPAKKIKLQINRESSQQIQQNLGPKTPVVIKAKVKGKPPQRPLGDGWDSEAADREEDPAVEENFVLRMLPGEDCEYLRTAITEKRIGIPKQAGGPDIHMKFLHPEGRRALISIRGNIYAATLVDLPCIVEAMKSWDKRGWWKTADICQMLWVFAPCKSEEEAKTIDLPKDVDPKTFQYPHGLTPPMHYARKRRFRKRISRTAIEAVEAAVEKLLAADIQAVRSTWEMIDPDARPSQAFSDDDEDGAGEGYSGDEDAEGDLDDTPGYFNGTHHGTGEALDIDMDADLEADLEAEMEAAMQESLAATPMSTVDATPINGQIAEEEEDSGDESIEGDDDDEDETAGGMAEVDEEEKARLARIQGTREDIEDMERQITKLQNDYASQQNPILKRRLDENIRKVKAEVQLRKSQLGEGDEDDE